MTPAALFVRIPPLPAAIEPAWNRWYDVEHIAYRLALPGFTGARRYRIEHGPIRYVALYELSGVDALTGSAYLAHRRWEEALPNDRFESIAPNLDGFARGVYLQVAPQVATFRPPPSRALLIVEVDSPRIDEDALAEWFTERHARSLDGVDGVLGTRLLQLEPSLLTRASGRRSDKPRAIVIHELSGAEVASRVNFRAALGASGITGDLLQDRTASMLAVEVYSSFPPA